MIVQGTQMYTRARFNYGVAVQVTQSIIENAVCQWVEAHPDFCLSRPVSSKSQWMAEFQEEGDIPPFLEWLFNHFNTNGLKPTEILGPVCDVSELHLFAAKNEAEVTVEQVDVNPVVLRQLVKFGNFTAEQRGTTFTLKLSDSVGDTHLC